MLMHLLALVVIPSCSSLLQEVFRQLEKTVVVQEWHSWEWVLVQPEM